MFVVIYKLTSVKRYGRVKFGYNIEIIIVRQRCLTSALVWRVQKLINMSNNIGNVSSFQFIVIIELLGSTTAHPEDGILWPSWGKTDANLFQQNTSERTNCSSRTTVVVALNHTDAFFFPPREKNKCMHLRWSKPIRPTPKRLYNVHYWPPYVLLCAILNAKV